MYEKPQVTDLGGLIELTLAGAIGNAEDGGSKQSIQVKLPDDGSTLDVSVTIAP